MTISPTDPIGKGLLSSSTIWISQLGAGLPTLSILGLSKGVTVLGGQVSVIPQPLSNLAFGQCLWKRSKISGELGAPKTTTQRKEDRSNPSICLSVNKAVYIGGTI